MNQFRQKLDLLGTIFGVLGSLTVVLAVALRLALGGGDDQARISVSPRSILLMGTATLVFGCFLKLMAKDR